MQKKMRKKINLIMLTLMLTLSGCTSKKTTPVESSTITEAESYTSFDGDVELSDLITFVNNRDEFAQYLSNPAPSYELLKETIKENKNISKKYQDIVIEILNLFEEKNIDSSNLGIFYENAYRFVFDTDYSADFTSGSAMAAYFSPDPFRPSITIDESIVDFYAILHEIIHSCEETVLFKDGKLIYITNRGIYYISEEDIPTLYGNGFAEGHAEAVSQYIYGTNNHTTQVVNGYNINNDILTFLFNTLNLNVNDFFSYTINDFEKDLLEIGVSKEDIDKIIKYADLQINYGDFDTYQTRTAFYKAYIPKLIEHYIEEGYNSKEIYSIIGMSLRNSVIENFHDIDDIEYYRSFINSQKYIFDMVEDSLNEILSKHDLDTYSIYDYIGHEFEIYYSLYGENTNSLNNSYFYFSNNWDETAAINSNIILYVEDNIIKMCNYCENPDGTLSCYDSDNQSLNIDNGVKLSELVNIEAIVNRGDYLAYNIELSDIIRMLRASKIECDYNKESLILSGYTYLYFFDNKYIICNVTTNDEGEIIPYRVSASKVYIVPENAIKIGSLKELYEEKLLTLDDENNFTLDYDAVDDYSSDSKLSR